LTVSKRKSYEVAPAACQLRFGAIVTPTLPSATLGEFGAAGAAEGVPALTRVTDVILKFAVSKSSCMTCSPALSVTGTFTLVQVCQPPVAGTETVDALPALNRRRSDAPPLSDATRNCAV
jgi:hypothetical protein